MIFYVLAAIFSLSVSVGRKIDFQIQSRVINLWTTPDHFNPNEVGSMHMILLDDQALEGGDSSNKGEAVAAIDTRASKPLGKRPVQSVEGLTTTFSV
ncbi:hypothetical protein MTR_8g047190 [Medicago truncatula]|uniref:Transmembrane protein n=1 Tax=Medicago truncatula TaxID=3880 RepID=A0A072TPG5_MEDTR|nr:hypothetical protein MTR_8g047190 [Medicago truncatula]